MSNERTNINEVYPNSAKRERVSPKKRKRSRTNGKVHATQHLVGALVCAKIGVRANCGLSADELDWLSRQVSGPEDPAEPMAGTPHGVWESPLSLT